MSIKELRRENLRQSWIDCHHKEPTEAELDEFARLMDGNRPAGSICSNCGGEIRRMRGGQGKKCYGCGARYE